MGYYTSFTLNVLPTYDTEPVEELTAENEEAAYVLCDDGEPNESGKWYDHEKDMKEFSKKHPDLVFKLHGDGEENGDLWFKYFKNGKMQVCKAIITFDEYDETKLV